VTAKRAPRADQVNEPVERVSDVERLRRAMTSKHPRPQKRIYTATCDAKNPHTLLWIAIMDGRLVPVAKVHRRRGSTPLFMSNQDGLHGLRNWPPGSLVPIGLCPCGVRTRFTADELLYKVTHGIRSERIPKVPAQVRDMS
jgi:hypothetical protein